MNVQFKNNPQMAYDIKEESATHYKLLIGWVPKEELTEQTNFDLPHAIDVLAYLANNQTN